MKKDPVIEVATEGGSQGSRELLSSLLPSDFLVFSSRLLRIPFCQIQSQTLKGF